MPSVRPPKPPRTCRLCGTQYSQQRAPRYICPACFDAIRDAGGLFCTICLRIRSRIHAGGHSWCGPCSVRKRADYVEKPPHVCVLCGAQYPRDKTSRHICPTCQREIHSAGNLFCVACHQTYPSNRRAMRDHTCPPCRRARSAQARAERKRIMLRQTNEERNEIAIALDSGMTVTETSRMLDITRSRVVSAIDAGWARPAVERSLRHRRHSHWMHSGEICEALGWTKYHWKTRRQYLPLTPYGTRWDASTRQHVTAIYIIEGEELYDWCADRMSWMLWSLADCSPDWQRTLAVSRPPGSIDWIYAGQAAQMIGLTRQALYPWYRHATMPLSMVSRISKQWIWPPDLVVWCKRRGFAVPAELRARAAPVASPKALRRAMD